jgi:hypothetical protein
MDYDRFGDALGRAFGGLSIIAIGPKGGKIVGYKSGGQPIYAGSNDAKKLSVQKRSKDVTAQSVVDWLVSIGFPAKLGSFHKNVVFVTPNVGKELEKQFGVKAIAKNPMMDWGFTAKTFKKHIGKPLTPSTEEQQAHYAAKAAAGEIEKDPFPPLKDLEFVKQVKSEVQRRENQSS